MKCILLVWCICSCQNVAAVTSTSTRTPIYKAYAKGENIGDVTAKGESVGNIADLVSFHVFHWTCSLHCCCHCVITILCFLNCSGFFLFQFRFIRFLLFACFLLVKLGTGMSILISKSNPSLVTSFAFLSCGYLLSSYHEVHFQLPSVYCFCVLFFW